MNYRQMVETAGDAMWRDDAADAFMSTDGKTLDDAVGADDYRRRAKAVLNAILPQVTTVAELEALPIGTLLLKPETGQCERINEARLPYRLPLTIVWTP